MKILINRAHTNDTPGKCSPDNKFREWVYSGEICKAIVDELRGYGFDAQVIEQKTYYGPGKGLQQVTDDVNKICAQVGAGNVILVSVHVNASSNGKWSSATGWSAYTTPGVTKADTLANDLYWAAELTLKPKGKEFRTDYSDGDPDLEERFYILKHTDCPAVLTENFFQDNKKDVAYLTSEEGKADLVKVHVDGILAYLQNHHNR